MAAPFNFLFNFLEAEGIVSYGSYANLPTNADGFFWSTAWTLFGDMVECECQTHDIGP